MENLASYHEDISSAIFHHNPIWNRAGVMHLRAECERKMRYEPGEKIPLVVPSATSEEAISLLRGYGFTIYIQPIAVYQEDYPVEYRLSPRPGAAR